MVLLRFLLKHVVRYEEEWFIGKLLNKVGTEYLVKCLTKPYGVRLCQKFENDAIFYKEVYHAPFVPFESDIDDSDNVARKKMWKY